MFVAECIVLALRSEVTTVMNYCTKVYFRTSEIPFWIHHICALKLAVANRFYCRGRGIEVPLQRKGGYK